MHKEGELEFLREVLSSEIQLLKTVSCCVVNKAFIQTDKKVFQIQTQVFISYQNQTALFACQSGPEKQHLSNTAEVQHIVIHFQSGTMGKGSSFIFILILHWVLCRLSFSFSSFFCQQKLDSSQEVSGRHQVWHNDETGIQVTSVR